MGSPPPRNVNQPDAGQTVRNVLAIWGNRLLLLVAPLVTIPLIVNHFGLTVTGVWLLTTQLVSQLSLLDAGLSNSLTRLLARQRAGDAAASADEIIATAYWVLVVPGILLLILAPWIASAFVSAFDVSSDVANDAWWLVLVAVGFVAFSLPLRSGYGMLGAVHRFDLVQLAETAAVVLRVLLIIGVIAWANPTLLDLGLIVFGTTLIGTAWIFVMGLGRHGGRQAISVGHASGRVLREMASMSGAALVVTLAAVLLFQVSPMLTGYIADTRAVAILTLPLFIYSSITPFFSTFALIASPIAAGIGHGTGVERFADVYMTATAYLCSAACAILIACHAFGAPLLDLWLAGPRVHPLEVSEMARVLVILLVGHALSVIAPTGRSILSSIGRHWASATSEVVTSLVGITLGVVLLTLTDMGVSGVAIGITTTLLVRGLLIFPVLLAGYFRVSVVALLVGCLLRPVAIAALVIVLGSIIQPFAASSVYGGIAGQCLAWIVPAIVWIGCTWRYVVRFDHQEAIKRRFGLSGIS